MIKSLLDDKLPKLPVDYVVAAVFLRLETDKLTQEELKKVIGIPGFRLPGELVRQWAWHSDYALYENPGDAVSEFIHVDLPKFIDSFRLLKEKHDTEIELHLVIGAGDFKKLGYIPNIEFNSSDLALLSKEELGIMIIMDGQMSKSTKHLDK